MTKDELYTAISEVHERGKNIVDSLKSFEQDLASGDLSQQEFELLVSEVRDITTANMLVGEDMVIANVITVCNILLGND